MKRVEVAQRKLHVAGLVPLGYVAVAKPNEPDHMEHERHTDDPRDECAGGPNPGEPIGRYVRYRLVGTSLTGKPPERASQAGPHPSLTIGDGGTRLQVAGPQERIRISRSQPARGVQRDPSAIESANDREDEGSEAHRDAKELSSAVGLAQTVVLARKRRCERSCSRYIAGHACEVDAPPAWTNSAPGQKIHPPPRCPRAVAEVDLLVEHEEAGVEGADLVEKLTSDEENRSDKKLGITT